jgi:uncharacterized membrane protein
MAAMKHVRNWKAGDLLIVILSIQIITCVTVALNIPFARQVMGFLYLAFIPGVALLRLLRLHKLDQWEAIVFSLGLSVAFLMLIGLLTNVLLPLIGVSRPLSWAPLLTIINGITLLTCVVSCLREKEGLSVFGSSKTSSSVLLLTVLPLLSIVGTMLMNASQNNTFLLLMIVAVSVLVSLITLFRRFGFDQRIYPIALLMISIALLFHYSLISNYVYGPDIKREQYLFRVTNSNSHWSSTLTEYPIEYESSSCDIMNAMLSVTVLPTIFSGVLNMEETWVLKIVYPLIFSFVPLGLYQLHQRRIGKRAAFLAAFFLLANGVFFSEMLGLARQMVAELFYVLLFLVILDADMQMNKTSRGVCFVIFSAGLIVSHYAISSLFMFFIVLAYFLPYFLKKVGWVTTKTSAITASSVAIFLVMLFAWYVYVSKSAAFGEITGTIGEVYRSTTTEFFNPQSRGTTVLRGLGMESVPSSLHLTSRIFAYITQFFIIVGFIALLKRRKGKIFAEHTMLTSLNMVLLMMCIVLPNFASQLNMTRLYHIQLFFLAPLCILGGQTIFKFIPILLTHKIPESYVTGLILIILIPYFLFETEFVYEVTGDDSWSLPLSKYRMGARAYVSFGLVDEQDVYGAKWLSKNINAEYTPIYTSAVPLWVLTNYGMTYSYRIEELSNTTKVLPDSTVYLTRLNTFYGIVLGRNFVWNITEISPTLFDMNKIYSNGGSEIYG